MLFKCQHNDKFYICSKGIISHKAGQWRKLFRLTLNVLKESFFLALKNLNIRYMDIQTYILYARGSTYSVPCLQELEQF